MKKDHFESLVLKELLGILENPRGKRRGYCLAAIIFVCFSITCLLYGIHLEESGEVGNDVRPGWAFFASGLLFGLGLLYFTSYREVPIFHATLDIVRVRQHLSDRKPNKTSEATE